MATGALSGVEAPGVVGVGIDAIEIDRISRALDRTPALLGRVWTDQESRHCVTPAGDRRIGSLATRFAAKEAVAKALGSGFFGFGFTDIEVVADRNGKPEVSLHAGAAARAQRLGIEAVHVSLSRTHALALAYAVAVRA